MTCALLCGCAFEGGEPAGPLAAAPLPVMDGSDAGPVPEPGTTFADVYDILERRCAGCHSGGPDASGGLDLSDPDTAYLSLVGAPSRCGGGTTDRVVAGDPDGSLLYRKVAAIDLCGSRMPPSAPLPAAEVEVIEAWIAAGATG
jgi:hypothetical protein